MYSAFAHTDELNIMHNMIIIICTSENQKAVYHSQFFPAANRLSGDLCPGTVEKQIENTTSIVKFCCRHST